MASSGRRGTSGRLGSWRGSSRHASQSWSTTMGGPDPNEPRVTRFGRGAPMSMATPPQSSDRNVIQHPGPPSAAAADGHFPPRA
jgi:hypothetical protein